ncbi:MAG: patatin-like phospholipase family protein [Bacteroidota bacterium]
MHANIYLPVLHKYLENCFGILPLHTRKELIDSLEWIDLRAGEVLINEGEVADCLYILLGGCLSIYTIDSDGGYNYLGSILQGESVGEVALLTDSTRSASVKASRDSVLVKILKEDFDHLCEFRPQVLKQFSKLLVKRLFYANAKQQNRVKPNVALLPLHSIPEFDELMPRLLNIANKYSGTHLIDPDVIKEELEIPFDVLERPDSRLKLNEWLAEIDLKDEYSLYVSPLPLSYWYEKCVRQADVVYLFVDPSQDLPEGKVFDYIRSRRANHPEVDYNLVLLHRDSSQLPTNTKKWLDHINPSMHLHIRLDYDKDIARLARFVTENVVGLACGGGGAKALSQAGVLKAFQEYGLEVDYVSGTSMGAIVAACFALDWSWEEVNQKMQNALVKGGITKDITFPIFAFLRGKNKDKTLESYFDYQIEDLWLNYLCVSCDLSSHKMMVHDEGSLWEAISASSAIPGVFPPAIIDGRFYVDGGLVNNLPGDLLLDNNCRYLISISVGDYSELYTEEKKFPSARRFIGRRLLGFKKRNNDLPGILQVFVRSVLLASTYNDTIVHMKSDVLLLPEVEHIGLLEWKKLDEAVKAGYKSAKQYLENNSADFIQKQLDHKPRTPSYQTRSQGPSLFSKAD